MGNSIVGRLIRKDLYLNRWLIVLAIVGGFLSFLPTAIGDIGFFFGMVAFITILIVFGLFVGMENVTRESREKISVFIQCLPLSPSQYMAAKVIAALIAYGSVWLILTVVVIGLSLAIDDVPNGSVPTSAAIMGLLLANFCVLLAIGIITHSQRWTTAAIIITNTSITLMMITLFNLPAIQAIVGGAEVVWHPILKACIAMEAFMVIGAFAIMLYVHSRRTDFI